MPLRPIKLISETGNIKNIYMPSPTKYLLFSSWPKKQVRLVSELQCKNHVNWVDGTGGIC